MLNERELVILDYALNFLSANMEDDIVMGINATSDSEIYNVDDKKEREKAEFDLLRDIVFLRAKIKSLPKVEQARKDVRNKMMKATTEAVKNLTELK